MAKKTVFISFDYENDRNYYYLLKAWAANDNFDLVFSDYSSKEINSDSVAVVKQALSRKINTASYTLVLVGAEANKKHKDAKDIGYKNWQNYEIAKSKDHENKLIGVKLDRKHELPDELLNSGVSWASFSPESVFDALLNA